ncbi:MAG: hypothetical protein KC503_39185 [Myxococcales bacterium]|nr:hypothetical protein [Myxococcales bacterium]
MLAGCGGRPPVGSNADGAGTQDAATSGADAGRADIDTPPIVPPTIPPSNGECAVAIRVDDCCQAPQPVALADVLADECLVLWEDRYNIPEACKKRWPKRCELVDCASAEPLSRVAKRIGGVCKYADECTTNTDCTVATNTRTCCACPEVVPRALLPINECLHEHNATPSGPWPKRCLQPCPEVLCAPCGVPASVECVLGDDINRCTAR